MMVFYIMSALFWTCIAIIAICRAIKHQIDINKEFQKMYDEAMEGLKK